MGRTRDDFDLLIPAADSVEAKLAVGLLEGEGIPAFVHNADFDMAELGTAAHDRLRRPDVLVPAGTLERARGILNEAWGVGWEDRYVTSSPPMPRSVRRRFRWAFFLLIILPPLVFGLVSWILFFRDRH